MLAFGTLNLPAGKAFIALQMLFAMGALKFEFAHRRKSGFIGMMGE